MQDFLRIASELEFSEPETYKALNREHNFRFKAFIEVIKTEVEKILPLTSGGCVFCEQCSYPTPCIKSDVKMESLSAFGIDVGKLCKAAGLEYSFREDMVYFTAFIFIKERVKMIRKENERLHRQ